MMWSLLLVAALVLCYAWGMTRGTAWLDDCSDDDFRLFVWEAEPHRTSDALALLVAQVMIVRLWAIEPGCAWLRIEGWVLFPWTRRLEQMCREQLTDPEARLVLDLHRVRWVSPGGRRLLRDLVTSRVRIQRWPRHLRPLPLLPGDE